MCHPRLALSCSFVLALALGSPARAEDLVPRPAVEIAPSRIDVKAVRREQVRETWVIQNRASCGVRIVKARALTRPFVVECPRWHLDAGEAMECSISGTSSKRLQLRETVIFAAHVSEDCKVGPRARVDARRTHELEPLIAKRARHLADAPTSNTRRATIAALTRTHDDALSQISRFEETAREDARVARARIAQHWAEERVALGERLERQRLKVQMIKTDDSARKAVEATIAAMRKDAEAAIDKQHAAQRKACAAVTSLRKEKHAALEELKSGLWHSKCGKTASQILKESGETIERHLAWAKGEMRPATEEQIAAKSRELDDKIDVAVAACSEAQAAEAHLKQSWIERIKRREEARTELELAKQRSLDKAHEDLAVLERESRAARQRRVDEEAGVERALETKLDDVRDRRRKLEREHAEAVRRTRAQHTQAIRAHADRAAELWKEETHLRWELQNLELQIINAHLTPQRVLLPISIRIDR